MKYFDFERAEQEDLPLKCPHTYLLPNFFEIVNQKSENFLKIQKFDCALLRNGLLILN